VRTVDAATGAVLRRARVGDEFFAEGLAKLGGRLYQLTWQGPTGARALLCLLARV
jgi:glutamine cyclotransferase